MSLFICLDALRLLLQNMHDSIVMKLIFYFFQTLTLEDAHIIFVHFFLLPASLYVCGHVCAYKVIWIITNVTCPVNRGNPVECMYDWERSAMCRTCTINYMFGWLNFFYRCCCCFWIFFVSYCMVHFFSAIVDVSSSSTGLLSYCYC